MTDYRLITGDSRTELAKLPDESVQCCVTSPPYFGLRDYGHADQIGLEPTPDEYAAAMVAVFREVKRVMKDNGTLWLNLGDSYGSGGSSARSTLQGYTSGSKQQAMHEGETFTRKPPPGVKPKDLLGIPWLVAFALRADGWYLRSDIIWSKPNPMPESVTDRPTKSHEYLFLLSKSERYLYNADAIKEPMSPGSAERYEFEFGGDKAVALRAIGNRTRQVGMREAPTDRNKRTVWTVPTSPYKGAHFACYPPKLIEPCILAGSNPGDTILDPFNGAATTGCVALDLGRHYIGIELNPEYVELSHRRLTT